jgi:hypothetical protein
MTHSQQEEGFDLPLLRVRVRPFGPVARIVLPLLAIVVTAIAAIVVGERGAHLALAMIVGVAASEAGIRVSEGWRHLVALLLLITVVIAGSSLIWVLIGSVG